jgi:hypothetical protein
MKTAEQVGGVVAAEQSLPQRYVVVVLCHRRRANRIHIHCAKTARADCRWWLGGSAVIARHRSHRGARCRMQKMEQHTDWRVMETCSRPVVNRQLPVSQPPDRSTHDDNRMTIACVIPVSAIDREHTTPMEASIPALSMTGGSRWCSLGICLHCTK